MGVGYRVNFTEFGGWREQSQKGDDLVDPAASNRALVNDAGRRWVRGVRKRNGGGWVGGGGGFGNGRRLSGLFFFCFMDAREIRCRLVLKTRIRAYAIKLKSIISYARP